MLACMRFLPVLVPILIIAKGGGRVKREPEILVGKAGEAD